jgi:HlyD family secretion protein
MKTINTEKSLRRYQLAGFISTVVMVGLLGGWSALANINGAVVAPATIAVESYSKKVQHKEGGIVREILVKDGDGVREGQNLVVLDDAELEANLAIIESLLMENLAKQARLEAQRDGAGAISFFGEVSDRRNEPEVAKILAGQTRLFEATRSMAISKTGQLAQQISQLEQQIDGINAQTESQVHQLALITQEVVAYRKLLKIGGIAKSVVLSLEREQARLAGERGELIANKATAEAKIGEVKLQIMNINEEVLTKTLTELRDVATKITELRERKVATASQLGRTSIKAPIAGYIYQLSIHTRGGVIAPGETLMLIVPKADELVLQAQIAPHDIDQVEVGQLARVRFPAFGVGMTPQIGAEVIQISADTTRVDHNSPPYYAVRLRIPEWELNKLANNKLKPGMPAEALIQTEARSPLSYLLKPLSDQIAHVFREE